MTRILLVLAIAAIAAVVARFAHDVEDARLMLEVPEADDGAIVPMAAWMPGRN
jgi:hypothetical protein